ncbi:MAG: non-ribosomal peptide synthetase module [Anaerosolibacter sp.]|jgi:hypothetical protein|uniref:DUF6063 family protein n=1 Tax=Anaerosolibacter sp. TaxID=1872527 RepID=UPI00261F1CF1|nr:DUF6063 family protein [Anaerosolibacter sp.]MDF2548258.1 non-ribosomal peptide synthetase module [Anaerosolibacter sp.]
MFYTQEQIVQAFKIYSILAMKGSAGKEYLRQYLADDGIRGLVDQFAKEVECTIFLTGDLLYMIPLAVNSFFHVSNDRLKQEYFPSKAINLDIYMMYTAIMILFGEFYDSYQTIEPTRDFIPMGEWLASINERILSLKDYDEEQISVWEQEYEYNWSGILEKWDAMDDLKENVQQTARTISRMSFLNIVKKFLEAQDLIVGIGNDEIQLTEKAKTIVQRYYMEQEYNRGILEFIYQLEQMKRGEAHARNL